MAGKNFSRNQIEKLLAEHSELTLHTTYGREGSDYLAALRLEAGDEKRNSPETLESEDTRLASLQGLAGFIAAVMLIPASVTASAAIWLIALGFVVGTIGLYLFRRKIRKRAKSIRSLRAKFGEWVFTHPVQKSWHTILTDDETVAWMINQWLLSLLDLDHLMQRIHKGVRARNNLLDDDSLRSTLEVEIDTLIARSEEMRHAIKTEATRIDQYAREHAETKKRKELHERRLAAMAEAEQASARDLDERMRAAEKAERERLANQERAQSWLYDDPDQ